MLFEAMSASAAGFDTDNDGDGEQQQQQQPRETLLQEKERVSLDTLPDEIILAVCELLDVPELGALAKVIATFFFFSSPFSLPEFVLPYLLVGVGGWVDGCGMRRDKIAVIRSHGSYVCRWVGG